MVDRDDLADTAEHSFGSDTTSSRFLIPASDTVTVQCGAATHQGKVRSRNEDHYVVVRRKRLREIVATNVSLEKLDVPQDEAYTLIVADGCGGEGFGHLASQLAIRTVWESAGRAASWLMNLSDADADQINQRVTAYAKLIQQAFLAHTHDDPRLAGMSTTWTCAYLTDWDAIVAHVGDSRAYHGRQGRLEQITRDHTLAEELLRSGASPGDVARFRNVLTRAFGGDGEEVVPDVHQIQLRDGDALLLCSDGLTAVVQDAEIASLVFSHVEPQVACDKLIELALDRGGPDNITVVLVRLFAVRLEA
jgi:serine/threonine protein phosphatase PrpC